MTTKELKEYLGTLVVLEKEKYMQERLMKRIRGHVSQLGNAENIIEPQRYVDYKASNPLANVEGYAIIGGFIGGILGLV